MRYEYEDELDRMRARRRGSRNQEARASHYDSRRGDYDDYENEDWDGRQDPDGGGYDEYDQDYDEYNQYQDDDSDYGAPYDRRDPVNRSGSGRGRQDRRRNAGGGNSRWQDSSRTGKRRDNGRANSSQRSGRSAPYSDKNRKSKRRKSRWILLEIAALIAVIAGVYFFMHRRHNDGYWTVAIFGVDSRDGNLGKSTLADVQMICNINEKTGEIQLVSVFRDTYLKIDSKGNYHKINEAYYKGGASQALAALNENLDLQIDDYVTFNWKAVAEAINILGGVDLEITDREFKYINSFITETVEKTGIASVHLDHAGANHLDGIQAVAYARLRLMDDDYTRTERQRRVVSLAMEKAKNADWSVLNNILVTVLPQVSTSIGVDDVIPVARNINRYQITDTAGFPFSRTTAMIGSKDCVVPTTLESNVAQLHQLLYPEQNYSVSSTVKKISARIGEDSGYTEVGKNAGSSGGGRNSGTNGEGGGSHTPAPEAQPPSDVESAESTEESTAESTVESTVETTVEDMFDPDESDSNDNEDVGPGVVKPPTAGTQTQPGEKPTRPDDSENSGPGVNPPGAPNGNGGSPGDTGGNSGGAGSDKPGNETTAAPTTQAATMAPGGSDDEAAGGGPGAE